MVSERPFQHRIVVTGMGAITNLGLNAQLTWEAMREGRSGIAAIDLPEFQAHGSKWTSRIAGQVRGFTTEGWLEHREAKRVDRFSLLGMGAAREAVLHSGIDLSKENLERCGVVMGSGVGGITTIEEGCKVLADKGPDRLSPFTVPRLMANATAGNVSIAYGLKGPVSTHVTACASSGHAVAEAVDWMRWGRADVMVVGGAEAAVSPICVASFMTMRALSTRNDEPTKASRPFDRDRDGFVMAEGAAAYILETEAHAKARGATINAEVVGHANAADAYHITAPD
jgi:3-oxoacyl-[acyl-carrier-protein] synthase II